VGWRQFDNVTSNFRQGGYGWSTDGGQTWHVGTHTPGTFRSDPVLDTTAAGMFHYNSLQQTFYDDEFYSTNGGASYTMLGPATGGDKQWITIDKTPGSAGAGNVYQFWSTAGNNYSGRQFSRSTDGGTTWMNPINVPGQPIWGTPCVAADGTLYMAGTATNAFGIRFVKSTNAKTASTTPTFGAYVNVNMLGDITSGLSINPGGLGGQVWCVCDTGFGPTKGNVYVLASIQQTSNNELHVICNRSTDGGTTWGTPVKVNDDANGLGNFHYFGTISVAPNGRLDAIWLDTRLDAGHKMSALYWSQSIDAGTTWSPSTQISGTFDPTIGYPNQNKMGDYMGMVSSNKDAAVIFPGTFNAEEDVYFVRIPALPIRVAGNVAFGNWIPGPNAKQVTYTVKNTVGTVLQSGTTTLGATGQFSFDLNPDIVHQVLKVTIKGSHWLANAAWNANIGLAGANFGTATLTNGDINNDNTVNLLDFSALSSAYGSSTGGTGWNAEADLNGDGTVNLLDFSILSSNYGLSGA